uniref:Uncharacterized protein n=1 Tax=Setaria viridis TaxID=4556 RepID=A0A4U6UTR8_SETVI|nr:hypothetical protein SEVIR_5G407300v2 [Setaria viridis]
MFMKKMKMLIRQNLKKQKRRDKYASLLEEEKEKMRAKVREGYYRRKAKSKTIKPPQHLEGTPLSLNTTSFCDRTNKIGSGPCNGPQFPSAVTGSPPCLSRRELLKELGQDDGGNKWLHRNHTYRRVHMSGSVHVFNQSLTGDLHLSLSLQDVQEMTTPEEHKRLREKERYAKMSSMTKQDKISKKDEA